MAQPPRKQLAPGFIPGKPSHNHRTPAGAPHRALTITLLLCLALLTACRTEKAKLPGPHETLLSIAAEFTLLSSVDVYKASVGQDLTGLNIARATLVRLANYQALHPGRLTPELLALQGRSFELLGDYRTAQANYREAAGYDTELKTELERRAALLDRFLVAGAPPPETADLDLVLTTCRAQAGSFRSIADSETDPFYIGLARRDAETAEVRAAETLVLNRMMLPDGETQSQEALEALVRDHRESARAMEHALRLARFHRALAETEERLHPPEQGLFDADYFRKNFDAATDLMYRVSQADGRPERLVARHELDALLAYGEQVAARAR